MPTIAVVDDDQNILTSVSMALEVEGYATVTYTDGLSALDGFKANPPDLAILDIKMPRMDGMETLRRLRERSDLPVIFLTSKDEEIDELFGLKMGADDFIRKPFSRRPFVGADQGCIAPPPYRFGRVRRSQGIWNTAIYGWTRTSHVHVEEQTGLAHGHRILDLAGARSSTWGFQKSRRSDGCCL